jgi:hypothetical protein
MTHGFARTEKVPASVIRVRAAKMPGGARELARCPRHSDPRGAPALSGHRRKQEAVMSWNPSLEPGCPDAVGVDSVETLILPRARDVGDFEVRRALPAPRRQMVGPFIFFL